MIENTKIIDSSAWIEYFRGTKKGVQVKNIISSEAQLITLTPVLAEIFWWSLKNNEDFQRFLPLIRAHSRIIEPDANLWVEAANKKSELRPKKQKIGLIDTLQISFQEMINAQIVTADNDFRGLPNTIML